MPDRDGYPTDGELLKLREWPLDDPKGWLEYAQSLWHFGAWGWPVITNSADEFEVSTGGWSGNEEIIAAMQEAQQGLLWAQVWQVHRRGGHYTFQLPETKS